MNDIDYKEAQDFEKSAFVVSLEEFRKLEKELNDLKKELDNSKFGAQCIVHELKYDKKTLIKENLELTAKVEELNDFIDEQTIFIKDLTVLLDKVQKDE